MDMSNYNITNSITWSNYDWEPECNVDPTNNSNPVDFIGQEHNDKLDYIADIINSLSYQITNDVDMQTHLLNILVDLENDIGNNDPDSVIINDFKERLEDFAASFYTTIEDNSYNSVSADLKIDFLEDLYVNTLGDSLQVVIDYIKIYENNLVSSTYSTLIKEDVLMYTSITKFSIVYFYDVEMGLRTDWNNSGLGGSETDPIVAADKVKHPSQFDAARRNWNKYESEVSNVMHSYGAFVADALTEFGAWAFGLIKDASAWLEQQLEDLL